MMVEFIFTLPGVLVSGMRIGKPTHAPAAGPAGWDTGEGVPGPR